MPLFYSAPLAATMSSIAIVTISFLLVSAVYNFNQRAKCQYTPLMWLYIATGMVHLSYNTLKLYTTLAPDSHLVDPNICQIYWQVYQLYIWGKLFMYLFYCARIYRSFRGSAFELSPRRYKMLILSVTIFYVTTSTLFIIEVSQWGNHSKFPLAPQISTPQIETWKDCQLHTDYRAAQSSMLYKIVVLYTGEMVFAVILLRLYVRKVLQLVGHLNFESIEVSMNSVRTVKAKAPPMASPSRTGSRLNTPNHSRHNSRNSRSHSSNLKKSPRSMSSAAGSDQSHHSESPRVEPVREEPADSGNSEMDDAFLQVAVKSTILVIISIFSSLVAAFMFDTIGLWLLDLDCTVNFVCMYLTFVFAKKWYGVMCYGTHKCCWSVCVESVFKCCQKDCCACNGLDGKTANVQMELSVAVDMAKEISPQTTSDSAHHANGSSMGHVNVSTQSELPTVDMVDDRPSDIR